MPIIPFAEWLPDQAAYQNPGVTVAKNVLPSASGYLPMKTLAAGTDSLEAKPLGAVSARNTSGVAFQYAGDASKLYSNVDNVWTDVSKVGGYDTGAGERWEFTQWKNKVLATNFSDSPQAITFGGSNFADLTTDFQARHITSMRDFVVVANTFDGTDGNVPSRVRWSAFNDETSWTVSTSTLSDYQDLKTAAVERIFGGEFGVVMQGNSIWRMTWVGAPVVWQFDEVLPGIGLIAPGAAAQFGDTIYFLSERGFFALQSGSSVVPIGANKVDRYVLSDLDTTNLHRISAAAEPGGQRVLWAYPGVGNVGGRPNKVIAFDTVLGRWSLIEEDVELIWQSAGASETLETLDSISASLDALTDSLDSNVYQGGTVKLTAFDADFASGFFTGANMAATIESKEFEIHAGYRTRLNAFRPLIEGGTVTAQVGTRNRQADAVTWGSSLSLRASGRYTTRENARYHRFRFSLSGDWTQAIGMQITPDEARRGERRG